MSIYNTKHRVNVADTQADLRRLAKEGWPKAIALMFAKMAERAMEAARGRTRSTFDLHSEWIPRGIVAIPRTPAQIKASEKALSRHGDMMAAVYLKGAADPSKSLSFMVDHEEGATRKPHGGNAALAVPMPGIEQKARTGTGRLRKRFNPVELLKVYRQMGSAYKDGTTKTPSYGKRRGAGGAKIPGNYFIIDSKSGVPMIARTIKRTGTRRRGAGSIRQGSADSIKKRNRARSTPKAGGNSLQFIYSFKRVAKIKKRFEFKQTVYAEVRRAYQDEGRKARPKLSKRGV